MNAIDCLPLTDLSEAGFSARFVEDNQFTVSTFFNCTSGIAKLPSELWRIWHPCDTNAMPAWLSNCNVFHMAKQQLPVAPVQLHVPTDLAFEQSLISAVQELYHAIAEDCQDNSTACLALLGVCHTLVVMHDTDTTCLLLYVTLTL